MADSLNRRDFVKAVSLLGTAFAFENGAHAQTLSSGHDGGEIKNDCFTISVDPQRGRFNILRTGGTVLITGGASCANSSIGKRSTAFNSYKCTLNSTTFSDQLGPGKRMLIYATDQDGKLDFEIRLSLYDQLQTLTIEAICKNVSDQDIVIQSLEPIRVVDAEGGALNAPAVTRCLTNGSMYYDTGVMHEFGTSYEQKSDTGIKGIVPTNTSLSPQHETVRSWWNAGLFCGYDKEGLALGYLENSLCLGHLLLSKVASNQIWFLAESLYAPPLALKPGKAISSNRLMIAIGETPYAALETYAAAVGKIQNARTRSIVNGWCSWFYTLANVTEEEVLLNAEFAAKHLKPFGMEYIQIDEGFQRWHGDWEGNERFPHGMKWLAERIKGHGFKPGFWIAPYVISEPTDVFQKHPEWLLKNADGTPKRFGNWPGEDSDLARNENPKRYCLDITHPGAAQWLHDLVDTIVNRWGYKMIKVDFIAWSILSAERYYDSSATAAQVYRQGFEIMRNAAGERCHLLDCGPGATSVGLIDSMRIEGDSGYGFAKDVWKTYFTDAECSTSAAAKRYYFHKRTWINDVDHICMGLLSDRRSEAAATIIALSGGNMISGDRLVDLSAAKLEMLQKITPSFGEAAVPVDLFDTDMPSVFALEIKKPFGEWTVVGFFNASLTEPMERKFSLSRLSLDPGKKYLAFDFWQQQFFGEVTGEISVTVPPGSVSLLSLHERSGNPQWISTDRHVTQGAVEIENISWNAATRTLSGVSLGPLNTSHSVFVYLPEPHPWTWGGYVLVRDYDAYSLRLVEESIIRVHVRFEKSDRVQWEIKYDEFFK